MTYDNYKYLIRRKESDKFLTDKAFKTAGNPKYSGYEQD